MKRTLTTLLFALIVVFGTAQQSISKNQQLQVAKSPVEVGFMPDRLARIDENISGWMADGRLNGCVVLIVRNGKIAYHKAFGYNDVAKKDALRTDHIFRIASQTKAITSAAVMMLYEEGKFLLDDPISLYIPEFAKQQVLESFNEADTTYSTVPAKSEVTIRQLLTHTAGLGYPGIGTREARAIYAKGNVSSGIGVEPGRLLADDVKRIARLPLMHQPGEKFTYGYNIDVLGYLVEVVSGMSLDQFFKKRIFEPLGMNDTYFFLPKEKQNRLVNLFEEKQRKLSVATNLDYPLTDGTYFSGGAGLSSTALDYAKFLRMMLNEGEYNGKRLLSRHTVRLMTMNQIGDLFNGNNKFGLGFGVIEEKGSTLLPTPKGVYEWGGAFSTTYWADPTENLVGIIYRQLWGTTQREIPNKFKVLVYQSLK